MRLVREENADGCHLIVHGPETEMAVYAFHYVAECMKRQAEIEMGLQAAGYQLDTTASDRRRDHAISRGADHRRAASFIGGVEDGA